MGRLVTIAIIVGTAVAVLGGLSGALLAPVAIPLAEHRVWFVWLCAILTGSVAVMAALVALRLRKDSALGGGNDLRRALAAVLVGGTAGAVLAQQMFDTSPRGRQLVLFALGALAGGVLFAAHRRLRRPTQRFAPRRTADIACYDASATKFLPDLHAASLPTPIVDVLLERRSRGRWFQFSLGSLLAFTLLASITLAVWVRGPMKRRQILAAIERSGGGQVGYASRAPEWIVDLLGDIARGVFDEVDHVELRNVTDADLARIGFLSRLRALSLAGNVTDEAMKIVAQLESLEELDLGGTNVSTKGLAELRRLPRLRSLNTPIGVDDAGLREITSLGTLTTLHIGNPYRASPPFGGRISGAGLDHLANLKQLRELFLMYQPVLDGDLAFLEGLPRLKVLRLDGTKVTDTGLAHLANLPELEWLTLSETRVNGSGFEALSSLAQLRMLNLGGAAVNDEGLRGIGMLTGLEVLNLEKTAITDAGLVHLKRLTKLDGLNVRSTVISDAGLPSLEPLTGLGWFQHELTSITPAGITRLEGVWQKRREIELRNPR